MSRFESRAPGFIKSPSVSSLESLSLEFDKYIDVYPLENVVPTRLYKYTASL